MRRNPRGEETGNRSSTPPERTGIQHPGVIDLVSLSRDGRVCNLWISEFRKWSGSRRELASLQEKVNNYISFALDGQMVSLYPQSAGKAVSIVLHTSPPIPASVDGFVGRLRDAVREHGIGFELLLE